MNGRYNVIILGSGITGTTLAAVLARQNVSTIVLDSGHHPKFAIGESMVPESTFLLYLISKAFDVPEAAACAHPTLLREQIGPMHGVKLNFGYFHSEVGKLPSPDRGIMAAIFPPEAHLFRQDTDAYMFATAVRYGADALQNRPIESIDFFDDRVEVTTGRGERIVADFLVDAGGGNSALVRKLGLRQGAPELRTNAGSIFTHMVGVKRFEEQVYTRAEHGMPIEFSQGTLHHIFDGGWVWVIPFNNHPFSKNPLCSIGLQFDNKRGTIPAGTPDERFDAALRMFPALARHLDGARRVREWVTIERMQYSARSHFGPRWAITAPVAGFVDPLFSRGLVSSFESVFRIASVLIDAKSTGRPDMQRLESMQRAMQGVLDINDRLVACSYIAFRDFQLWNAWYRIWSAGVFFANNRLQQVRGILARDGIAAAVAALEDPRSEHSLSRGIAEFDALFNAAAEIVEAVSAGTLAPDVAAQHVFALLRGAERILPPFGYTNPQQRYPFVPDEPIVQELGRWMKSALPEHIRTFSFDIRVPGEAADFGKGYRFA